MSSPALPDPHAPPSPGVVARSVVANLARAARRLTGRSLLPRDGAWLRVRVAPPLDEISPPRLPFARQPRVGLLEALASLEAAAGDPRIVGVVLRFQGAVGGLGRMLALRRAALRVRDAGKPVLAYAESYQAETLLAASGATRVYLPAAGSVFLVGLRLQGFFLRQLLDKLDVRPEILHVGSHKSAGDRLTRDSLSPEDREQLEALADDRYRALTESLAQGRGLGAERVRELVDAGPYAGPEAVRAGLVDGCCYPDELEQEMLELAPAARARGDEPAPRWVDAPAYHALRVADPGWRPLLRELPRVAYVVARGGVHPGRGPRGIGSDSLRELLERLRQASGVAGVVLRVESPGGDPVASDLLWRAVGRVSERKPVVVSMGEVVASGGYYLAAAADALFAEAATVTGSIGVVGGKLDLGGLYQRLGVGVDGVERGARAGLLSEARGFTGGERAALKQWMEALYETFVSRVAEGRDLPREEVARVAQGRIYSGEGALGRGLIDALGGPLEALREVRRRAGLGDDERVLLEVYPRQPPLPEWLGWLRGGSGTRGIG